ncbi:hypothetical protein RP20_CCG009746 [Aedes albopictus]|nr:hypothetical protein RP20_CCG009746 [Aedes albopictus]
MQLMVLYAAMSADGEKEDKCQMLLTYLDRLLMFRPLESDNKALVKDPTAMTLEVPVISLADDPNSRNPIRKAVKYAKSPTSRSPSPRLLVDQPIDHRQYLIYHQGGCSCQFCRFPQYKCQALLVATMYARLAFLKGQFGRCQEIYDAVGKHWNRRQKVFDDSSLVGHRDEFATLMARGFLYCGQFRSKEGEVEQARGEFHSSLDVLKRVSKVDEGLVEEVKMNIAALEDLRLLNQVGKEERRFPEFENFIKEHPRPVCPPTPSVQVGRMNAFTPRVGTTRIMPKTAVRADDLIKLVARKRLKTTLAKDYCKESELVSAMSGLSCASERRPNPVSIFVDTPEKPSGTIKGKKKLFTQEASSKDSEESPKKRGRRKKTQEGETPAAPKSTRKKRIQLSPALKTSSSNESFKDILVKCSTPITISRGNKCRTATSKKPKMTPAFPKLNSKESKSPEITQNHSFNSSFRDVLLQSLTESTSGKPLAKDSSVIVLDDSDVINTSLTQNNSVNESRNGCLSLKKYSDRKPAAQRQRKVNVAKACLQFDTSSPVIDITTPDQSPAVLRAVGSSGGSATTTATTKDDLKKTRGRTRANRVAAVTTSSSRKVVTKEVSPEVAEAGEVIVPRTTRNKVRTRRGDS